MHIALYAITTLAFLGFSGWFLAAPALTPVFGMAISVAGMIGSFLTDEDRKKREELYWQDRRLTVGIAFDRVEKELDHLFALRGMQASGRGADVGATAVEPSYDLLQRDVSLLTDYRAYSSLARKTLAEIEAARRGSGANVAGLLTAVERLAKRLKADPSWVRAEQ